MSAARKAYAFTTRRKNALRKAQLVSARKRKGKGRKVARRVAIGVGIGGVVAGGLVARHKIKALPYEEAMRVIGGPVHHKRTVVNKKVPFPKNPKNRQQQREFIGGRIHNVQVRPRHSPRRAFARFVLGGGPKTVTGTQLTHSVVEKSHLSTRNAEFQKKHALEAGKNAAGGAAETRDIRFGRHYKNKQFRSTASIVTRSRNPMVQSIMKELDGVQGRKVVTK